MEIYNFKDHKKGDTFKSKEIALGFDITGATIRMHFKLEGGNQVVFKWETADNTFIIEDALLGVITMDSRILDYPAKKYVYDFELTDQNGNVTTYFGGAIKIIQDITV
jgi:hypothetical protein